jgi:23S rRNA (cytosine1962-C5)-methyltransferase
MPLLNPLKLHQNIETIIVKNPLKEILQKKHPWIYSNKFKKYTTKIPKKFIVKLISEENEFLCYGFYFDTNELVSIRIFSFEENTTIQEIHQKLIERTILRKPLLSFTDSVRLIHGENDGFPGITIDYHAMNLLVRVYHPKMFAIARFITNQMLKLSFSKKLGAIIVQNIYFQNPRRVSISKGNFSPNLRTIRGIKNDECKIKYRNLTYTIALNSQKGGLYNDIRNLREYFYSNKDIIKNSIVLNLFSNNGLLSYILVQLGAEKVISLEDSQECITIHKKNNSNSKNIVNKLDIFSKYSEFIKNQKEKFNLIIIDPPSLTKNKKDIPKAKLIYTKLIVESIKILEKDGVLVIASCSNRIHENEMDKLITSTLNKIGKAYKKIVKLKNEIDHPILPNFPEGHYFKVFVFKIIG